MTKLLITDAEILKLRTYMCAVAGSRETAEEPYRDFLKLEARLTHAENALAELMEICDDVDARKQIDSFTAQPARAHFTRIKGDT